MAQSFIDRYQSEREWSGKAMVMEIFHLAACQHDKDWTMGSTAKFFGVSIGLASENLKLADTIHRNEKILECKTRQEALQWMGKHEQRKRNYSQILAQNNRK